MSQFADIAAERMLLADLVESLTPEQLATPSLCGEWTVQQVAGHLLVPLILPTRAVLKAMLAARGNFDRANAAMAVDVARRPAPELARLLRERAANRFTPPTHGPLAPLTDVQVHGQDIRRPLGLDRQFDADRLRASLDFLTSPAARRGFVPKGRTDGLRFVAEDLGWTAGAGAPVSGSGEAVLMALAGRPAALADLTGDGVADLAARL